MTNPHDLTPSEDLRRIIESARRLGVEIDEPAALRWLSAMAVEASGDDVAVDVRSGVFGHRTSLLDFDARQLAYYRRIGRLVEIEDQPGRVETALALSGSAAQSKIQTFPGDCDYFERVNLIAPTREAACGILAEILRDKALATRRGDTHQLIEVKFGTCPRDIVLGGKTLKAGAPIAWTPADVEAGRLEGFTPDGRPDAIAWEAAALDPGWCKLDWVIADPVRGALANASNMLDVTWEAPDGSVHPLDGYLDPYFQEVYLDAESVPIFAKLARHLAADALDTYVEDLEREIQKYVTKDLNYGKAAKRMYNVFRITGRYEEAAYLRELFDEPATALYQTQALVRTLDDVVRSRAAIDPVALLAQADALLSTVDQVLDGPRRHEAVRLMTRVRDELDRGDDALRFTAHADAARAELMAVVNDFFHERLTALPSIQAYLVACTEA